MEQNATDTSSQTASLGAHGTTPSGKPRLFVCGVCTRAFARHEHLKRHERSHTKEKPFGCGVCQRRFSRRDLLLRHAQKLHAGCDDAIKRLRRRSTRARDPAADGSTDANGKRKLDNENGDENGDAHKRGKSQPYNFFATNNDVEDIHSGSNRRMSFSAQSGANYAANRNPNKQYTDSVEFSTPQLAPADINNPNNWLSDINTLPGLEFLNNFQLDGTGTSSAQPRAISQQQSHPASLLSSTRHSSMTSMNQRTNRQTSNKSTHSNDVFGYSFYDDDYNLGSHHDDFNNMKLSYPKLPSTYLYENTEGSSPTETSNGKYNEYDLLSELEVPNQEEKILTAGYSFYDSNEFISPAQLARQNGKLQGTKPQENGRRITSIPEDSPMDMDDHKEFTEMSSTNLYTSETTTKIAKVLERYPFIGSLPPTLPPIEKLNECVDAFKVTFLRHYPFIHKNILNEKSMLEYTLNPDAPDDFAPTVCLPLLIATIGALYSGEKKIAADLYEHSRRCIHVYLDSRKKSNDIEKSTTHNSPLWLVQSLVLSVLYGLFGEYDDSDLSVILKQVNALCTLIRISKFTLIKFEHESIEINDEYFKDYILYQSKVRTVFMIFNISSMLTCIYNLSPFLKYKELKCDLPDLESYWECTNVAEFKQVCIECQLNYNLNLEKIMNDMVLNNQINYKVSEFGSIIMMYAVLQYFYFNRGNVLTNYSIGISPDHQHSSNLVKNYMWEEMLTDMDRDINMESIILRNITVIRSLMIDLTRIKEAMWNRQWGEFCKEFFAINPKNDDLIDACDYSVRTLSMMFLNDVDSSNFHKSVSLSSQCLVFNFFYITKFCHRFEKYIFKHVVPGHGKVKPPHDVRSIAKNFSIYVKIVKFLADLEQLLTRNFGYHDPTSKLALKEFDPSKITFGYIQKWIDPAFFPKEVSMENVIKIVDIRLSSNVLKIAEFIFAYIYENKATFNIFKSLGEGMAQLRLAVENDLVV